MKMMIFFSSSIVLPVFKIQHFVFLVEFSENYSTMMNISTPSENRLLVLSTW